MLHMSIKINGAKELGKKLKTLSSKEMQKVTINAMQESQEPVRRAVEANALSMVGGRMGSLIAKNVKLNVVPVKDRPDTFLATVGLDSNIPELRHVTLSGKEYFIPAVLEFGYVHMDAIPFMRTASDATREIMIRVLIKELKKGIEEIATR